MSKTHNPRISYEPEADIFRIRVSDEPIEHAREMGDFIVHFSKQELPVYVEILDAKRFIRTAEEAFRKPTPSFKG